MKNLFNDFKVIELSSVLAGPSVGMFFAELGANVIKVENPKTYGDVTRSWKLSSESDTAISSYFCSVNWGKRSIGLDFSNNEHYLILEKLIENADLITVSFKPGDDKNLNLDYDEIKKINPKIIYAQITGFGPDDERTAFDAVLQAYSGFTYINGTSESGPLKMPVALIDVLSAHQIKEAVLLAYINRLKTNEGAYIHCSLLKSGISSLVNQASNYLVGKQIPQPTGSDHPNIAPYGKSYRTRDEKLLVLAVGNDKQFLDLCKILNLESIAKNAEFISNQQRVKNRKTLNDIIGNRIKEMSSKELISQLDKKKVPAAIILDMKDVFEQQQAKDLIITGESDSELLGVKSFCAEINNIKNYSAMSPPPRFNQHREEILREELNYSNEEIDKIFK